MLPGLLTSKKSRSLSLSLALGTPGRLRADIVDVTGRLVRVLRDGTFPEGTHDIEWDLRDERGTRVASGVYFCRIASADSSLVEKIVALR